MKPGPDNNDYFDNYHYYQHVVANRRWSAGIHRAIGFKIKTGKVGRYPMNLSFTGDVISGDIQGDLAILVQEEPGERIMTCLRPEHMSRDCAVGLRPL
jgi:hypothetical protein